MNRWLEFACKAPTPTVESFWKLAPVKVKFSPEFLIWESAILVNISDAYTSTRPVLRPVPVILIEFIVLYLLVVVTAALLTTLTVSFMLDPSPSPTIARS